MEREKGNAQASERQRRGKTDRQTDRQRQRKRQRDRQTDRQRQRQKQGQKQGQRQRQRQGQRKRDRDRQTDRQTETERQGKLQTDIDTATGTRELFIMRGSSTSRASEQLTGERTIGQRNKTTQMRRPMGRSAGDWLSLTVASTSQNLAQPGAAFSLSVVGQGTRERVSDAVSVQGSALVPAQSLLLGRQRLDTVGT